MMAFCMLRNVHDVRADGQTSYKARFGEDFDGPIIPFGCAVTYKPSRKKDQEALAKLGQKTCEGIFMGYHQKAGGGWSGDVDILDSLELTTAGDIEEVHTKRISAAEMVVTKLDKEFVFPIIKYGWDQPNDGHKLTRRNRVGKRLEADKDENVSANFIYPDSNTTNQSINKHINFGRNSINKTHNKINK